MSGAAFTDYGNGQMRRNNATITASVVLYRHPAEEVESLFQAFARDPAVSEWIVVDNGGSEEACATAAALGGRCLRARRNLGFGAAHNLALASLTTRAPYHLIVNPDIHLVNGELSGLAAVMDALPDVGLLMPRIVYPDGTLQYLCKLFPTPFDLFLRRFASGPWHGLFQNRMNRYDMKSFDYARPVYVPVLSGCFMFARRSVLDSVGGFDERFFLYMEDVDLCRRIGNVSRLLFWPWVTVAHRHAQGSYKHSPLLFLHIRAAIAYFNKWGWFRDPERKARNFQALQDAEIDVALALADDEKAKSVAAGSHGLRQPCVRPR